ncbi:MAG: hypothetical protein IIZ78_25530 [Clostridiales bacterium]|nr:hypothetical protein [Clostridiales bacterium]
MVNSKEARAQLCEMVSATGLYILKHADEIVDHAELKVEFEIKINFAPDDMPIIEIIQSHLMHEVVEVRNGQFER